MEPIGKHGRQDPDAPGIQRPAPKSAQSLVVVDLPDDPLAGNLKAAGVTKRLVRATRYNPQAIEHFADPAPVPNGPV